MDLGRRRRAPRGSRARRAARCHVRSGPRAAVRRKNEATTEMANSPQKSDDPMADTLNAIEAALKLGDGDGDKAPRGQISGRRQRRRRDGPLGARTVGGRAAAGLAGRRDAAAPRQRRPRQCRPDAAGISPAPGLARAFRARHHRRHRLAGRHGRHRLHVPSRTAGAVHHPARRARLSPSVPSRPSCCRSSSSTCSPRSSAARRRCARSPNPWPPWRCGWRSRRRRRPNP